MTGRRFVSHLTQTFGLRLRYRDRWFEGVIVTLTEEGDVVLGLSLEDPMNDPAAERHSSGVLARLLEDFGGSAGIGGVELPPPQSRAQWHEDALVRHRVGSI